MKKVSVFVILAAAGMAPISGHAATCPTGYLTVDMPDVEIVASCDAGYTSAGTIDDCAGGAGVCAVSDITCEPGYYIENGECQICKSPYFCPDGISRKRCPQSPQTGLWPNVWCNGGQTTGCTSITGCIDTQVPYTSAHGSGTIRCGYNQNNGQYDRNCEWMTITQCDAGYWIRPCGNSSTCRWCPTDGSDAICSDCYPAGIGYYSPEGSTARTACPDGYTTRTETATSETDCVPLCTAGATMLHVGSHTFNLYPDSACASPAIHIGLDGGTCCAHLEKGEVTGAMHVRYEGTVYHTTN